MIRVLLIDDAASFRALLRFLLPEDADIELVGEAGDTAEAIRLAGELRPDCVLIDINLGRENGLEAIAGLRAASPATKVVAMSGTAADAPQADGFALKDADASGLRDAIRAAVAG